MTTTTTGAGRRRSRPTTVGALLTLAALTATAGCSAGLVADGSTTGASSGTSTPASTSSPAPPTTTATTTPAETRPHVAGYAFGEISPVPLFTLPDLAMLDTSLGGFSATMDQALGALPGVRVGAARCDATGAVLRDDASILLYGDGSGTYTGPDGTAVNYGDGSGSYSIDGTEVVVYGDGSGTYSAGTTQVISYGDGSGLYRDAQQSVQLYGDGSGNQSRGAVSTVNYGDGSGNWTDGEATIVNYGNGSGSYADETLSIINHGDGTGTVDGAPAALEPMAKVAPLGSFPSMGSIKPVKACATTISLRDDVLFDFDSATLRPAAAPVLAQLAKAMTDGEVGSAVVEGHTDSVGTDTYNQDLSERRAAAVVAALQSAAPGIDLDARGFGETRPVAANEVDGKDDPAGRQLNRRVDVVIPSAAVGR